MKRYGLLFGVQNGGLSGVLNDVETMSTLLGGRGFEIRRCTGEDATREGILAEFERLIGDVRQKDTVVVYYSGHGGYVPPADGNENPNRDWQYIVPYDFEDPTSSGFNGIVALELSALLARLTERTANCTVILDCCHSAHLARDPGFRTKAWLHPTSVDIDAHIDRLRQAGLRDDLTDPVSNKQAIRLVACSPSQFAYEYTNGDGMRTGLLTESLRIALEEADGLPVTWTAVIERIRRRVQLIAPTQRPEVEGQPRRLVFDTAEIDFAGSLPVVRSAPNRVRLPGARLLGIRAGDTFAIMPAGAAAVLDSAIVAVATVDQADSVAVAAVIAFRSGHTAIPPGAQAFLLSTVAPRWQIVVRGEGPVADQLRTAVAAEPTLRPVARDDTGDESVLAEVDVGNELALRDAAGLLTMPARADSAGVKRVVANASLLAKAASLRTLTPDPGETLNDPVTVEWGRVVDGNAEPLAASGAVLHSGDDVYIRLRNDSDRNLFFYLFGLSLDGAIVLVTISDWSGLRLEPGREYIVGRHDSGKLEGVSISWPDGVPAGLPRPETAQVLVTSAPEDLSVLAQAGARDPWVAKAAIKAAEQLRGSGSPLQRAIAQAEIGGRRTMGQERRGPVVRYAVHNLDYLVSPLPRPTDETARFVVDERPPASARLMQSRDAQAPSEVAVRLDELVVHSTSALGGADVRVDGLVLTAGDGGVPVYRSKTMRFGDVHDGERLSLDNVAVYQGLAIDCLDIAWWVSSDRAGSLELEELLARRVDTEDLRRTAADMAALATTQPQAAFAVAAAGAGAVIINTADQVLSTVAGDSIALYRTSLLAAEHFGIGRHPRTGLVRAQDFSFAYRVDGIGRSHKESS